MRNVRTLLLLMLALLASCRQVPSAQSIELESKTVPAVEEWSRHGPPNFNLAAALPAGDYEAVCIVPEYRRLSDQKGIGRIEEYHSAFGMHIPENHYALMLIGDHKAHAALLTRRRLTIETPSDGKCVPAGRAVLRTVRDTPTPVADLQQL
jgi:hypothetical protein